MKKVFLLVQFLLGVILVFPLSPYEKRNLNIRKRKNTKKKVFEFVDDYHFPMLADDVRNGLYFAALKKAIVPTRSKVLDAGAGTMLLSMMSIDLGAREAVGIEANPVMCDLARDILQINGYSNDSTQGKIRLFNKYFEEVRGDEPIVGQSADVFVSETFDAGLIGENFLSILSHAKANNLIKKNATIIPHSASIYIQLLESTLSLPSEKQNGTIFAPFRALGRYNLEPIRPYRPSGVYTVRYLDEKNAVRKLLSSEVALFHLNFQRIGAVSSALDYKCVIVEVAEDGIFDSIGIWFDLILDSEKELVLSNAPEFSRATCDALSENRECKVRFQKLSPCWMQALYRVSSDVLVRKGDVLRLQIARLSDTFVFGEVGNGRYNSDSRLIKFISVGCDNEVKVYAYSNDDFTEREDAKLSEADMASEYLLGSISRKLPHNNKKLKKEIFFNVFPARVYQRFKLVTRMPSGKQLAMMYQLPDSTANLKTSYEDTLRTPIPLDQFKFQCPSKA